MTAPVMEYRTVDKSTWGYGEWQDEPDKVQWVDEATNLDCLIVRGPSGALCGYVGVAEGHPFFGIGYDECPLGEACGATWCNHSPGSRFDVHGGLTFADFCHEPSREAWERWRAMMLRTRDEAAKYPRGDSAERWREQGALMDDYEAWHRFREARGICHLPLNGRPARVWWLGFDCAHSGDVSPKYDRDERRDYGWYKPLSYVQAECAKLAQQLAEVAA